MANAIQTLLERDGLLLTTDANERTISAQLACYLKQALPEWDVDVEYNRQGLDPKKIGIGGSTELVYPDIIVHRRRSDANLLVVEMKKGDSPAPDDEDLKKLRGYAATFKYPNALFLRLSTTKANVSAFLWV
ncbi:hypothetical protein [Desulfatirhabdium butyrativorans]|uniref:hypothetical protein n=1 Tax=Desulfatirhabdium butyrativorans TaxID=340467 RepID=UPI0012EB75FB|nr:hypothetical protein [Desulfatirhabdium butyrativorans]